jgi:hypothetical protein
MADRLRRGKAFHVILNEALHLLVQAKVKNQLNYPFRLGHLFHDEDPLVMDEGIRYQHKCIHPPATFPC